MTGTMQLTSRRPAPRGALRTKAERASDAPTA
jgi:hypothetical protein